MKENKELISIRLDPEDVKLLKEIGSADSVVAGVRGLLQIYRSKKTPDISDELKILKDMRKNIENLKELGLCDKKKIEAYEMKLQKSEEKYNQNLANRVEKAFKLLKLEA